MRTHETKSSGLTLTELLILTALVGILAAIAFPAYSVRTAKGKSSVGQVTNQEPHAVYYTARNQDALAIRAVYPGMRALSEYATVSVDEAGAITVRHGVDTAQFPDKTAVGASLRLHGRHVQYLYEVLF